MISSDNFYCFLQFEGGHVPQCPIAGDATGYHDRQQQQEGDFIPVYEGRYSQREHDLGSIIGFLLRRIMPALKVITPQLLRTSASILEDVRAGKFWNKSSVKRVPDSLVRFAFEEQSESGK
jgi:hypothetical protein